MTRKTRVKLKDYPPICADTVDEWFGKVQEADCYVECKIREARMHKKHCELMQIVGGVARHPHGPGDPTDLDIILRSTGACFKCPVYKDSLDKELT